MGETNTLLHLLVLHTTSSAMRLLFSIMTGQACMERSINKDMVDCCSEQWQKIPIKVLVFIHMNFIDQKNVRYSITLIHTFLSVLHRAYVLDSVKRDNLLKYPLSFTMPLDHHAYISYHMIQIMSLFFLCHLQIPSSHLVGFFKYTSCTCIHCRGRGVVAAPPSINFTAQYSYLWVCKYKSHNLCLR